MIENIENIIIAISRYFLIVFGALSLIAALFLLIYSISLILDRPSENVSIEETTFMDIEGLIFPSQKSDDRQENIQENSSLDEENQNFKEVDQIYFSIRKSMSLHFNDSADNIKNFNTRITPRSLSSYIENNYLNYSFLTSQDKVIARRNLANFFNSIENRFEYKRVGDFDNRLDLITDTIDLVFNDYYDELDFKNEEISRRISESNSKNIKGYENLTYVLYLIAIYAAAVLYLMIFKVEIDLRRIPKAIENNE